MKVLVACEESQAVTIEFRKLGIEAFSCDIQECSGGHPEWHILGDAITEAYSGEYSLMIAHPPCTYLSNAGAVRLYPKGILNIERYNKGLEGKEFFMMLLNAPIEYIAIENPIPSTVYGLPNKSQMIEPYYFGDEYKKKTYLWLKNLPPLYHIKSSDLFQPASTHVTPTACWVSVNKKRKLKSIHSSAKMRSKTFPGIAKAMATQWTEYILSQKSKSTNLP